MSFPSLDTLCKLLGFFTFSVSNPSFVARDCGKRSSVWLQLCTFDVPVTNSSLCECVDWRLCHLLLFNVTFLLWIPHGIVKHFIVLAVCWVLFLPLFFVVVVGDVAFIWIMAPSVSTWQVNLVRIRIELKVERPFFIYSFHRASVFPCSVRSSLPFGQSGYDFGLMALLIISPGLLRCRDSRTFGDFHCFPNHLNQIRLEANTAKEGLSRFVNVVT